MSGYYGCTHHSERVGVLTNRPTATVASGVSVRPVCWRFLCRDLETAHVKRVTGQAAILVLDSDRVTS